jgi:hypothetical protein
VVEEKGRGEEEEERKCADEEDGKGGWEENEWMMRVDKEDER